MSNLDFSNLKATLNNHQIYQAFLNVLEEKQAKLFTKLLNADNIEDVKFAQGAWFELERLKNLKEEVNGAEKNGRTI
jgi:hypothetical protein